MAAEDDVEYEYTRCLQEIDRNFVKAVDAGGKLLKQAKVFDQKMQEVARQVTVWCNFFSDVESLNKRPTPMQDSETGNKCKGEDIDRSNSSFSGSQTRSRNDTSRTSNDIPPTPKMPIFSKSFAKTPMGAQLGLDGSFFSSADSSGLDVSLLESGSPPKNVFFSPATSPIGTGRNSGFPTTLSRRDNFPGQVEASPSEFLNISGITPVTPPTPENKDYGNVSQLAKSSCRSKKRTPAKSLTDFVLSSGLRKAMNTSGMSSNPATPTLQSPVTMVLSYQSDDTGEGKTNKIDSGSSEEVSSRGRQRVEDEEELLVGISENDMSAANGRSNTSSKKRSMSTVSNLQREGRDKGTSHQTSVGTPLSMSIAKRLRKSLPRHLQEEETLVNDDEEHPTSNLRDDIEFDDSFDEEGYESDFSPAEFSLSLFPALFQEGEGAAQVTGVYSQFEEGKALTIDHLRTCLPEYNLERLELMVEMLVSRNLLRPFRTEGRLYWRLPQT